MEKEREDLWNGDDLAAILVVIEADALAESPDILPHVDAAVADIPEDAMKPQFQCSCCENICLTKRGLSRHYNGNRNETSNYASSSQTKSNSKAARELLHPSLFKYILEKSVSEVASNECYRREIIDEFQAYSVGELEKVNNSYDLIRCGIEAFTGDVEDFILNFINLFLMQNICLLARQKNCCLLFGFEVASHVVAHLSGATISEKFYHCLPEWLCIWDSVPSHQIQRTANSQFLSRTMYQERWKMVMEVQIIMTYLIFMIVVDYRQ